MKIHIFTLKQINNIISHIILNKKIFYQLVFTRKNKLSDFFITHNSQGPSLATVRARYSSCSCEFQSFFCNLRNVGRSSEAWYFTSVKYHANSQRYFNVTSQNYSDVLVTYDVTLSFVVTV